MNFGQNVCFDHFFVRFFMCYDTQVSVNNAVTSTADVRYIVMMLL